MGRGWDDSWRDFKPPEIPTRPGARTSPDRPPPEAVVTRQEMGRTDRGRAQGAKWCVVVDETLYEKATADAHGLKGILFRSRKEAKRWIYLLSAQKHGQIRNLRRGLQPYPAGAKFALMTRNPAGLMVVVMHYIADFVYEERSTTESDRGQTLDEWAEVVEDTKPGGMRKLKGGKKTPFREETYSLKKRWFEAQYGKEIRET